MDKITYLKFLDGLSLSEYQDYLEAVWREDIELNEAHEKWLAEHLESKKRDKVAHYAKIFILLLALLATVPAYEGPIRRIVESLSDVEESDSYALMWVTKEDDLVCPICAPLNGKIIGQIGRASCRERVSDYV